MPGDRIVGLSKLARVVEHFARRLQVQERMTVQIADWLEARAAPKGVGVVLDAEHFCMTDPRRPEAGRAHHDLGAARHVRNDPRTRAEFLALATERR